MSEDVQVAQANMYAHRKDSGFWDTRKKQKSISQNYVMEFELLNIKPLNLRVK